MGEAAIAGLIGASSLLVGAVIALVFRLPTLWIGLIMGFGVGALISAVAFELVVPALDATTVLVVSGGLLLGAVVFFAGDTAIERMGGGKRKSAEGEQEGGSARSIVFGTVLDGIPEQAVLGMSIATEGMVSIALLAGIWISNLPEALGASSGLKKSGWSGSKIVLLWSGIVVVSVAAAVLGYLIVDNVSGATGAFISAFAGGALLAMITSTMAPEAFKKSGRLVGLATTLGFILAVGLTSLEI